MFILRKVPRLMKNLAKSSSEHIFRAGLLSKSMFLQSCPDSNDDLKDNYFSVRGELVFVNNQKKEVVIKICSSPTSKRLKNPTFKIIVEGEISLKFLNNFVSLDVVRDGNILRMIKCEIIEKIKSAKS